MKAKKLISTILASAMALSMAVPAFASTTKISALYQAITIDVTVPTTGTAVVNPYGLPLDVTAKVNVLGDDGTATGDTRNLTGSISGQGITTTTPLALVNKTTVDLDVNATVTGTVKGNLKLINALQDNDGNDLIKNDGTGANNAIVAFEIKATGLAGEFTEPEDGYTSDTVAAAEKDSSTVDYKGVPHAGNLLMEIAASDDDEYGGASSGWAKLADTDYKDQNLKDDSDITGAVMIVTAKATDSSTMKDPADNTTPIFANGLLTLKKAELIKDTSGKQIGTIVSSGGVAVFRLTGKADSKPKTDWTTKDGVDVTIAFTFTPNIPDED